MNVESATKQTSPKPPTRRLVWREARRQLVYLSATLAAMILAALGLGMAAAGIQASRDETRSADLALVVAPAVPPESLADHVFERYRRGYVRTILLAGEGQTGLKAQLVERGVPEASLQSGEPGASPTVELRRLAREAQAGGATSALVITAPEETLRTLKIVRDQGLRAYGAPDPGQRVTPLGLVAASAEYWRYVLLGL